MRNDQTNAGDDIVRQRGHDESSAISSIDDAAARDRALLTRLGAIPPRHSSDPRLLLICGLPASGKSRLSRDLVAASDTTAYLASDAVRLDMTGGKPTYEGSESARVFGAIGRLASSLLSDGYSVIIDSTGIRPRDRHASLAIAGSVRAMTGRSIPTGIAWCVADPAIAAARLTIRSARRARLATGEEIYDPTDRDSDLSEADAAVYARMSAAVTPPRDGEAGDLFIVDTTVAMLYTGSTQRIATWLG